MMNAKRKAALAGGNPDTTHAGNYSTVARFHELRRQVANETSTSPLFLICWCGVRSALAVDGEPSEPCAICSKQIDGGAA